MSWVVTALARSAFGRAVSGALTLIVVGALFLARRDRATAGRVRDLAELETLRDRARAIERMHNADIGNGNADDDLDWLRRRAAAGSTPRREPPLVRGHRS